MPSVLAQISHRCARSRVTSSGWRMIAGPGRRSVRTASFCRLSGMPPNRATSGFLPLRSTLACTHLRAYGEGGGLLAAGRFDEVPSRHPDDDLSLGVASFQVGDRCRDLRERVPPVD